MDFGKELCPSSKLCHVWSVARSPLSARSLGKSICIGKHNEFQLRDQRQRIMVETRKSFNAILHYGNKLKQWQTEVLVSRTDEVQADRHYSKLTRGRTCSEERVWWRKRMNSSKYRNREILLATGNLFRTGLLRREWLWTSHIFLVLRRDGGISATSFFFFLYERMIWYLSLCFYLPSQINTNYLWKLKEKNSWQIVESYIFGDKRLQEVVSIYILKHTEISEGCWSKFLIIFFIKIPMKSFLLPPSRGK